METTPLLGLKRINTPVADHPDEYRKSINNHADILEALAPFLPKTGDIKTFGGTGSQTGWLPCDGAAVSRTTYAALFAAIGTTHGSGDGSTTFNVPDLRGRAVVGAGTGPGLTARTAGAKFGDEAVLLTGPQSGTNGYGWSRFVRHFIGKSETPGDFSFLDIDGTSSSGSISQAVNFVQRDADVAHPNVQPSTALTCLIKT